VKRTIIDNDRPLFVFFVDDDTPLLLLLLLFLH